jgi:GxxExxY protein
MTLTKIKSNLPEETEKLAQEIIDSAVKVHSYFGPGLTERIYEESLVRELGDRKIPYEQQKSVHICYERHDLGLDYKLDLIVSGQIVVELKCVDSLLSVHKAQLMCYMNLVKVRLGLLINFNAPTLTGNIKRIVI